MLLDAHIHLQDIKEENIRAAILGQEAGAGRFFCNGIRPEDWPIVSGFARQDRKIIPFLGVHPWHAAEVRTGWEAELESLLETQPETGIGEIGLDKSKEAVDFEKQKSIFLKQLQIAGRLSRPVAIHGVRAWGDLLLFLRDHKPPRVRFMMHSFHGSAEVLRELLALGGYISFSWKWVRNQKKEIMELARQVPLDQLLLETDFPYTEPGAIGAGLSAEKYFKCLHETYAITARARGITEEQLQKAVWDNGTAFLHRAFAR